MAQVALVELAERAELVESDPSPVESVELAAWVEQAIVPVAVASANPAVVPESVAEGSVGPALCQPVARRQATTSVAAVFHPALDMVRAEVPSGAVRAGVRHAPAVPEDPAAWVATAAVAVVAAAEAVVVAAGVVAVVDPMPSSV